MTKPSLTAQNCLDDMAHALGGVQPAKGLQFIRDAGEWLTSLNQWSFLRRGPIGLPIRTPVPLTTSASWGQATKTITKIGAFTNYTHVPGDRVRISAGTGLTLRYSRILSKTSANIIVIEDDLGPDTATLAFNIPIEFLLLPPDFDMLLGQDGQTVLELGTEFDVLMSLPSSSGVGGGAGHYQGMLMQQDATDGGAPVTVLAFSPGAAIGTQDVFTIFYQRTFPEVADATSKIAVPFWLIPFFRRACQCVALGYHREDEGTTEERLDALQASIQFHNLMEREGMEQGEVGQITGGYTEGLWWGHDDPYGIRSATVTGP